MTKCKDCLHVELCARDEQLPDFTPEQEALCQCFVDRHRYVVRKKGEWKPCFIYTSSSLDSCTQGVEGWECSNCGYTTLEKFDFCTCGADMRKGENG